MPHKGETPSPRRGAFTLIELLLVLVILGVLAGIVVPRLVGRGEQAKIKAAGIDIASIAGVLKTFEVDCGRFPNTQEGLGALMECPQDLLNKGWSGPYLDKLPKDPWGQDYQYRYPGTHNERNFDLWSVGPDGQDGGGDDIDNWTQK